MHGSYSATPCCLNAKDPSILVLPLDKAIVRPCGQRGAATGDIDADEHTLSAQRHSKQIIPYIIALMICWLSRVQCTPCLANTNVFQIP